ncbi:ubiquitin carboxyl-terminal hydrolase 33 isoform X2 [Phymastichus coffea]|uniref:ubiquitin carboxyl-terminal hydrolase 33 isoform X2 n=1 Tax=Phymastichus coffea TaxID=108790 RepID=UPI00273B9E1D|nr:ubiquitin carboxyl-terminal hydrolase 33 isoform X2 [Phymastichus coffea]
MPLVATNCSHTEGLGDLSIVEDVVNGHETFDKCVECDNKGYNLWLCLYPDCRYVGCAEQHLDHSTLHNRKLSSHSAHMNLSSNRIWCYSCQSEVHTARVPASMLSSNQIDLKLANKFSGDASVSIDCKLENYEFHQRFMDENNMGNRIIADQGDPFIERADDSPDCSDLDESEDYAGKPRGLVGLQNIGNTCYMNSALQALSNVPPLTHFFTDCGHMVSNITRERKPTLSLSYLKLVREIWSRRTRGFVVPHAILTSIRTAHPMFRGYHQHDTQEFLRCFMDQLHEELKEIVEEDREGGLRLKNLGEPSSDEEEAEVDGAGSSQSDGEYETCDSGVSEQSSLSDEGDRGMKRRYSRVSQSEKQRSKFSNRCAKKGSVDVAYSQQQRSPQSSPAKHRSKKQTKTRSIISDIFDGKLLSSVQCLTCDRISTRIETFQDLSLPIPSRDHIDMLHQGSLTPQKAGPCSDVVYVTNQSGWFAWFGSMFQWVRSWFWGPVVSLHDCLSAFFSADELKGDNMYSCEKCNKLRNGIKFSKVLELPEVLCIHLKRFRHELMFSSKIASYVSFPLDNLDMRPYLHKDCVSKVTTYNLISVICHHGTAGGGHYVCYALNAITNQWFEFDDQCVTPVSPETVKNCGAYVLFYKKRSKDMMDLRRETVDLVERCSKEPSEVNYFVSKQWINRFNTFAEPGPIDNSDFLCPHGGVNPARAKFVDKLCTPIAQPVWEFLFQAFGGGPVCTHLYECSVCEEKKYEALEKRRFYEQELLNQLSRSDNPNAAYALAWFRQWQTYLKNKESQSSGPTDNSFNVVNRCGQTVLKVGSEYSPIPEDVWQAIVNTYGSGAEAMHHSSQRPAPTHSSIPTHSTASLNLVDQNPKLNRVPGKLKQSTSALDKLEMMQESSVPAENNSVINSDIQKVSREVNG